MKALLSTIQLVSVLFFCFNFVSLSVVLIFEIYTACKKLVFSYQIGFAKSILWKFRSHFISIVYLYRYQYQFIYTGTSQNGSSLHLSREHRLNDIPQNVLNRFILWIHINSSLWILCEYCICIKRLYLKGMLI